MKLIKDVIDLKGHNYYALEVILYYNLTTTMIFKAECNAHKKRIYTVLDLSLSFDIISDRLFEKF